MISLDDFRERYPGPISAGFSHLYRFYKFEEQYLKTLFVDGLFHFSSFHNFNDPFEARPIFDIRQLDALRVRKTYEAMLRNQVGINYKKARCIALEDMKNHSRFSKVMTEIAFESYKTWKVACFSACHKNILMWSHYAESHQGYCLGVDARFFNQLPVFKVNYTNDYPYVLYPTPNDVRCYVEVLNKSIEWSYEQEFRCIFPADGYQGRARIEWIGNCVKFPKDIITDVYLGNRMSRDNREKIIEIIRSCGNKLNIWQAELHESQYKLTFTPVSY